MDPKKKFLHKAITVNTAIDVGVADGTSWLYDEVKYNRLILVEPLVEYNETMKQFGGTIYNVAAGSSNGKTTINVNTHRPNLSSIHERAIKRSKQITQRKIEVLTLDTIMQLETISGPVFLKIDTEGHELEVLRGAENLLTITDYIVAEVSRVKRFYDSYTDVELKQFLHDRGFVKYMPLRENKRIWYMLFMRA